MNTDRPRVLIVEEELQVAALEAAVVSRTGCASEIAGSITAALDALDSDPPDILLLGSPAETEAGSFVYDVLETSLPQLAPRTIVVTTSVDDASVLAKAARAGVFAVISRPFELAALSDVIGRCVRNDGRDTQVMWIGVHPATVVDAVDPIGGPVRETVH